ncbi:unnamed protein product, partial [Heterosigma akashiwo]
MIVYEGDSHYVKTNIADLPCEFLLNKEEVEKLDQLPKYIIETHMEVVQHEGSWYWLNPTLVHQKDQIVLCIGCHKAKNIRDKSTYSIASGVRLCNQGGLTKLNEFQSACISPVRVFNQHLTLDGTRLKGHAISFLSDGPTQITNKAFPRTDEVPLVTFIGSKQKFDIVKEQFRHHYALPEDAIYPWVDVLLHLHPDFQAMPISRDEAKRKELRDFCVKVEQTMIFTEDDGIKKVNDLANSDEDEDESPSSIPQNTSQPGSHKDVPHMTKSNGNPSGPSSIPTHQQPPQNQSSSDASANKSADNTSSKQPIQISRLPNPLNEWQDQVTIVTGAFPTLFLQGQSSLPPGTQFRPQLIQKMLRRADGRFQNNAHFWGLLFNQQQRRMAIQNVARVASTTKKKFETLATLVKDPDFKELLKTCVSNPDDPSSKQIAFYILQIFKGSGNKVPFSAFERNSTYAKLVASTNAFGAFSQFLTYTPTETMNSLVMRVPLITKTSSKRPYYAHRNGVCGQVSSAERVLEHTDSGRIHIHATLHGTVLTPDLVQSVLPDDELTGMVCELVNTLSCASLPPDTRKWWDSRKKDAHEEGKKLVPIYTADLPSAKSDYEHFVSESFKHFAAAPGAEHQHSKGCMKTKIGKHICRLARPAPISNSATAPKIISCTKAAKYSDGERGQFIEQSVDQPTKNHIDRPLDYDNFEFMKQHLIGSLQIVRYRPPQDGMLVEGNPFIPGFLHNTHHNNQFNVNTADAHAVNEYVSKYQAKGQSVLRQAAPVLLTMIDQIKKHPSKADDTGSDIRTGKHVTQRCLNAITGNTEHQMNTMILALLGEKSYKTTNSFRFIFLQHAMNCITDLLLAEEHGQPQPQQTASGTVQQPQQQNPSTASHTSNEQKSQDDQNTLRKKIITTLKFLSNNNSEQGNDEHCKPHDVGGVFMRKTPDGTQVFVNQFEHYLSRPLDMWLMTLVEYETQTDLKKEQGGDNNRQPRGKPKRRSYKLKDTHPLAEYFEIVIRQKFLVPMFAGHIP